MTIFTIGTMSFEGIKGERKKRRLLVEIMESYGITAVFDIRGFDYAWEAEKTKYGQKYAWNTQKLEDEFRKSEVKYYWLPALGNRWGTKIKHRNKYLARIFDAVRTRARYYRQERKELSYVRACLANEQHICLMGRKPFHPKTMKAPPCHRTWLAKWFVENEKYEGLHIVHLSRAKARPKLSKMFPV